MLKFAFTIASALILTGCANPGSGGSVGASPNAYGTGTAAGVGSTGRISGNPDEVGGRLGGDGINATTQGGGLGSGFGAGQPAGVNGLPTR